MPHAARVRAICAIPLEPLFGNVRRVADYHVNGAVKSQTRKAVKQVALNDRDAVR